MRASDMHLYVGTLGPSVYARPFDSTAQGQPLDYDHRGLAPPLTTPPASISSTIAAI